MAIKAENIDEAKAEVVELVEFLRDPKKFTKVVGRIPKGVLLTVLPGTGKTLLARPIAGEAGVPFLSSSGSDFGEMLVVICCFCLKRGKATDIGME